MSRPSLQLSGNEANLRCMGMGMIDVFLFPKCSGQCTGHSSKVFIAMPIAFLDLMKKAPKLSNPIFNTPRYLGILGTVL